MARILINLWQDVWNKINHYIKCEIVEEIPEVGDYWHNIDYTVTDVKRVYKDPEQPTDEAEHYDVYKVSYKLAELVDDPEEETSEEYVAFKEDYDDFEEEEEA